MNTRTRQHMNTLKQFFTNLFKAEEPDPMKYLIAGLGNMGAEYDGTRHNIGFDIVDHLAIEFEVKWENDTLGDLTEFKHKGRTFVLLKPTTYMNRSGKSIRHWLNKKKILPENLLVIVDDMNIDFGKVRLRGKGSNGGHNGLKDIEAMLSTTKYARLRVGIGSNFARGRQVDFVLGKWSNDEAQKLPNIIKHCKETVKAFGTIGISHTMSQYNKDIKLD